MSAHSGAAEAVDRILNRGGGVEEVLAGLHERVFAWVGVEGTGIEAGERSGRALRPPRCPTPRGGRCCQDLPLAVF